MALASWSRAPSVPVTATRSDPAKSTNLIVDVHDPGASRPDHQPSSTLPSEEPLLLRRDTTNDTTA